MFEDALKKAGLDTNTTLAGRSKFTWYKQIKYNIL